MFDDEYPPMGFDSWDAYYDAIDADEQAACDAMLDGLDTIVIDTYTTEG